MKPKTTRKYFVEYRRWAGDWHRMVHDVYMTLAKAKRIASTIGGECRVVEVTEKVHKI